MATAPQDRSISERLLQRLFRIVMQWAESGIGIATAHLILDIRALYAYHRRMMVSDSKGRLYKAPALRPPLAYSVRDMWSGRLLSKAVAKQRKRAARLSNAQREAAKQP